MKKKKCRASPDGSGGDWEEFLPGVLPMPFWNRGAGDDDELLTYPE